MWLRYCMQFHRWSGRVRILQFLDTRLQEGNVLFEHLRTSQPLTSRVLAVIRTVLAGTLAADGAHSVAFLVTGRKVSSEGRGKRLKNSPSCVFDRADTLTLCQRQLSEN